MIRNISFLLILSFISLLTQGQKGMQPMHLSEIKMVNEVAVSPDGNFVAYSLVVPLNIKDGTGYMSRELHLYDVSKRKSTALISGRVNVSSLEWKDDNLNLYYRQNTDKTSGAQVFTINIEDKTTTQITDFDRGINSYSFRNSDELFYVMEQRIPAERQKMNEQGIDIKLFEEELSHLELYRYNLKKNKSERILENLTIYDFVISPDGTKIAAAVSVINHIDYYYMFQRINIIDAENGEILKRIDNPGKLGNMAWCPNSRRLAFVASSGVNDAVCGSLFVTDTQNPDENWEDLKNLVQDKELSVIDVVWKDSNQLLYTSESGTDITLNNYNLRTGNHDLVIPGAHSVFRSIALSNSNIYFAGNTYAYPNELMQFSLETEKLTKLTDNNKWLESIELAAQEKITYYARDGKDIEGVLVYPLNYKHGEKYPLIVYIHGGPEAAVKNGWNNHYSTWGQFAASRGYFVFSPNYRASSGRGVDFTMVGFGDLLGVEYDDVLDGIDHLIDIGFVDEDRVGIGGGSYGGFFAAYSATKHSDRFAASVVFVGISNQISKRKTTDIPLEDYLVHWGFWTHENWEKVWDASPVKYVNNSNTPTLILHGEDDTRIPVSQGLELYRGLKLHGKAPVRFIIYPGEGHGNAKNINRYDYLVRTLEWFDFYLKTNQGSKEMPPKYIDYGIE